MARPLKSGLDYFPLDVDILQDIKVRKISKTCGQHSFTILVAFLCEIYKDKGYYIKYDQDSIFCIGDQLGLDDELINKVILKALEVEFFDRTMFDTHHILTSGAIQSRYLAATQKRKNVVIDDNYLISSDNNSVNDVNSTQSKVKEIKVKESKPKENIEPVCLSATINIDGKKYIVSDPLFKTMTAIADNIPYIETLCVNNTIGNKEEIKRYLKLFFVKLQNEGTTNVSIKDAKQHFANWLRLQLERKQRRPTSASPNYSNKNKHNFANYNNDTGYDQF